MSYGNFNKPTAAAGGGGSEAGETYNTGWVSSKHSWTKYKGQKNTDPNAICDTCGKTYAAVQLAMECKPPAMEDLERENAELRRQLAAVRSGQAVPPNSAASQAGTFRPRE